MCGTLIGRCSYFKLAKVIHPDKNTEDSKEVAEQKFFEITHGTCFELEDTNSLFALHTHTNLPHQTHTRTRTQKSHAHWHESMFFHNVQHTKF